MPIAESESTRLAYVAETTQGTTPARPRFKTIRFNSEDLRAEKQTVVSNEIRSDKNVTDVILTGTSITGGFTSDLSYGTFDDFMEFALRSAWNNDVLKNGVTRKPFSLEKKIVGDGNTLIDYKGCLINTLSMSIGLRSIIEASFGINALSSPAATTSEKTGASYADASTEPVMSSGTFVGTITASGISNLPAIITASIEINGNNREQPQVGSNDLAGIALGRFELTGTLGLYFQNAATYNRVLGDNTANIKIPLGKDTGKKYLIGQALRCVRGIEVDEDSLSLETIRATCIGGPGHYLGSDQTLKRMQTDYVYPALADRSSPKEWEELQKPDLIDKAFARKNEILSQRASARFDPATDAAIRKRFNIYLPV